MAVARVRRVGSALAPIDDESRQALAQLPLDAELKIEVKASRNDRRHRLFFALVGLAYQNWPHGHAFNPVHEEHLRSRLLVEAGWCDELRVRIGGAQDMPAAAAVMTSWMSARKNKHCFVDAIPGGMLVRAARSIAYARCEEAQFLPVFDRVVDIIQGETGISAEDLKRHAAEVAGLIEG